MSSTFNAEAGCSSCKGQMRNLTRLFPPQLSALWSLPPNKRQTAARYTPRLEPSILWRIHRFCPIQCNHGSSHWQLAKSKGKPTCCQQRRHIQACQQQWERDELRSPQACTRGFPPAPRTSEATTARTSVTTRITTTTKSPIPTATVQLYHVLLGFKEHLCLCQK